MKPRESKEPYSHPDDYWRNQHGTCRRSNDGDAAATNGAAVASDNRP